MTIIAFIGIPGSGKSTTAQALAKLNAGISYFLDEKTESGEMFYGSGDAFEFSLRMWLRSLRVKQMYEAEKASKKGQFVCLDAYYDKLMRYYLGKKVFFWIMRPENIYFKQTKKIAQIDYKILPEADIIVALKITEEVWRTFLKERNRKRDSDETFLKEYFQSQKAILKAGQKYCKEFHKTYIEINQYISSPQEIALKIQERLKAQNIIF